MNNFRKSRRKSRHLTKIQIFCIYLTALDFPLLQRVRRGNVQTLGEYSKALRYLRRLYLALGRRTLRLVGNVRLLSEAWSVGCWIMNWTLEAMT
jgi:hypothetical protein